MIKGSVSWSAGSRFKVYVVPDEGGGFRVHPGTVVVDSTVRGIPFGNATDVGVSFDFGRGPFRADPATLGPGQSGLVFIDWDRVPPSTVHAFTYSVRVGEVFAHGNSEPTIIIDP